MTDRTDAEARIDAAAAKREPDYGGCDHGVTFDPDAARGLSAREVQERWPRGVGPCPKGCGYDGIAYASFLHYVSGDW